ncbi:hypothetical protein V6N13_148320 [Hibiscus sabdariffa]
MLQPITPAMSVLPGYMEWFYENGKPFIMNREARARVLRVPRPERPRQERGPRPTGASTATAEQSGGAYTSAGAAGPSAEPYTPMPTQFPFQPQFTPMPPPTEGFFTGAFQPYSSMMVGPSHSPVPFYPPPLSFYPPQGPTFGSSSSYGMVQQTPPGSLFATRPSGSGHQADESEEDDDDTEPLVRRNPHRNRRAPDCGTGGHRRH